MELPSSCVDSPCSDSVARQPTQTRPVAECVVNMTVKAPMFGGPLRFTFENERHEYTEAEGFGRFVEERIDHMLARKRRELTFIDVVGDFDKTRLPKSYASGEDAELEAAAIRIQGIGRQKLVSVKRCSAVPGRACGSLTPALAVLCAGEEAGGVEAQGAATRRSGHLDRQGRAGQVREKAR